MTELAVEIRGLRKAFGSRTVLDGIDLAVERGSVLGYIGPNGAGKSTTVKILCGLTPASRAMCASQVSIRAPIR
jgi:ABC-2 type transport system ATP-binding protein